MNFEQILYEYRLLYENPENYGGDDSLTIDSNDVVTFVYLINKKSIIFTEPGEFSTHQDLIVELKKLIDREEDFLTDINQKVGDYIFKGDFRKIPKGSITPKNLITGRVWINHKKLSIWEYTPDFAKKYIGFKDLIQVGKYIGFDVTKFEIELTELNLLGGDAQAAYFERRFNWKKLRNFINN